MKLSIYCYIIILRQLVCFVLACYITQDSFNYNRVLSEDLNLIKSIGNCRLIDEVLFELQAKTGVMYNLQFNLHVGSLCCHRVQGVN